MTKSTIEEFYESGTYHRIYDLPGDNTSDEIEKFITNNNEQDDEGYLIRYSWIDENGNEQWRSTYSHFIWDNEDWEEEFEGDAEQYGVSSVSGFQVVYMGRL